MRVVVKALFCLADLDVFGVKAGFGPSCCVLRQKELVAELKRAEGILFIFADVAFTPPPPLFLPHRV